MVAVAQEFLRSMEHQTYSLPPGLCRTYVEMLSEFENDLHAQGFRNVSKRHGFEDQTLLGVAHRLYWWFPTHFCKFQQSLILWEQQCRASRRPFLLDRPRVTFVDLGCGAGAASAAVLSVLDQYHSFCSVRGNRTTDIEVRLIGVDSSPHEVHAYSRLVRDYTHRLESRMIDVTVQTICGSFPEVTPGIIESLAPVHGHVLILGMSNLINWIWKEYDEHVNRGDLTDISDLKHPESVALRDLAQRTAFDVLHVVGIAVKRHGGWFLSDKLREWLLRGLVALRLAERPFGMLWSTEAELVFENPEGSVFANRRPQGTSRYRMGTLVDIAPGFLRERRWTSGLSLESLEAAWAKIRCYMRYESLTDEVEVKLFESDLEANLAHLGAVCKDYLYSALNIARHLPYDFPKSAQETRPRSLPRLEEQIAATAVCLQWRRELEGRCPEVSYSSRLAPADTEFLYNYWFAAYREYLGDALRSLDRGSAFVSDIKAYYVSIRQALLKGILARRLKDASRCLELLACAIERDCRAHHEPGYGLLQGHALSGLLANVMLQPVDHELVARRGFRGRYFRFADDMTVTRTAGPSDKTEKCIEEELAKHDARLQLNTKKTLYYSPDEFRRHYSGSRQLDELGKRFRALLLPVFLVNVSYRSEFRKTDWFFIHRYQRLLEGVGIYFSAEWLHRKVDEYGKLGRWLRLLRDGWHWHLHWPSHNLAGSPSGERSWTSEFTRRNAAWVRERASLKADLGQSLQRATDRLLFGRLTDSAARRWRRTAKFALYRLSVLGIEDAVGDVYRLLLGQPWNIPVDIACQALVRATRERELQQLVEQSSYAYVRAVTLRSLGRIRTKSSVASIVSVLERDDTEIENLMASEALLDANLWQGVTSEDICRWLRRETGSPYVQKNIVIMLGQAYPNEATPVLRALEQARLHPIVQRAIHYVLTKPPTENLLWKPEPDVLRKYRAKSYPTIEEILGDAESYALASPA